MARIVSLFLEGEAIGHVQGPTPRARDGNYAPMSYRGLGHYNLGRQLEASQTPSCHYAFAGRRVDFTVLAFRGYGRRRLIEFAGLN